MSHQHPSSLSQEVHHHKAEMRERKVVAKSTGNSAMRFREDVSEHEREIQKKVRDKIEMLLEVDLDDADFAELLLARTEINSVLGDYGFEASYDEKGRQIHVQMATGENVDKTGDYDQEYRK